MMKARKYFDQKTLLNLYYTFIYPYIVYCNHIWGQTYDKYIEKVSVLQRRVIRIIAGVNRRTNTDIYYEKCQILYVKHINMYVICLCMYRFHHNLLPEVLFHTEQKCSCIWHTAVSVITCTPCPSNLTKRGVKYWGVKIWNQLLGQEIDIDVSQPIFKHNCKRIISAGHLYYIWANLKCCYGMESVYNVFSVSDWDCLCYSVVCFQSTSINWWNVSMLAPLHLAHELDHLRWNSHWDI